MLVLPGGIDGYRYRSRMNLKGRAPCIKNMKNDLCGLRLLLQELCCYQLLEEFLEVEGGYTKWEMKKQSFFHGS